MAPKVQKSVLKKGGRGAQLRCPAAASDPLAPLPVVPGCRADGRGEQGDRMWKPRILELKFQIQRNRERLRFEIDDHFDDPDNWITDESERKCEALDSLTWEGCFLIRTMALFHKATSVLTSDPSVQWRCVTAFVLKCLDAEIVALLRDIP